MKHVRRLFRRTECLRIGRAQRHQSRLEPLPYLGIGVCLLQIHVRQCGNPLEIGQWRHVHDRKTRQFCCGDLDHQNPDRMVGVLRFLHGKTDQIVAGKVDLRGRDRVQLAGQIARENRPVHRLVAQLDANLGPVAIDQFCGLLPADQSHIVTRHQQLRRQQGAVRSSQKSECYAPCSLSLSHALKPSVSNFGGIPKPAKRPLCPNRRPRQGPDRRLMELPASARVWRVKSHRDFARRATQKNLSSPL